MTAGTAEGQAGVMEGTTPSPKPRPTAVSLRPKSKKRKPSKVVYTNRASLVRLRYSNCFLWVNIQHSKYQAFDLEYTEANTNFFPMQTKQF